MAALPKLFQASSTAETNDSLQSRIEWLNKVRLFEDIRGVGGAVEHVAKLMEIKTFPKGVAIISEGDDGTSAFFLISGSIKVLKSIAGGETFPVAILDAKDHPFFGEAALVASDKRSATIRTDNECVCLILEKAGFDQFCTEYPHWALPIVLRIGRVVLERLHKANNDVVLLYNALVNEVKGWSG